MRNSILKTRQLALNAFCLLVLGLAIVLPFADPVAAQQPNAQEPNAQPQNAQEPKQPLEHKIKRQIFVPFEDLNVLLDGNSDRVMISRDEYEELLASAKTREINLAPQDSVVVDAQYSGRIEAGVALITGRLIVEPLNQGLVQVPLSINGLALREAKLDDEPANMWRNEKGEIVLLISGDQRQTLTLEMSVPVQTTAARQTLTFQLPALSATRFDFTAPGNVEVKSGLAVADRKYDEASDSTRFELLVSRQPMNLVMSLNNRQLKDDQVIVANSVLIHKLDKHVQELHVTTSLDVIHGAVEQIQFKIPTGYQVRQVTTDLLNQWEVKPGDNGDVLNVQLREPSRDDVVINISAARVGGEITDWQVPEFETLEVAGQISVIGILADVNLQTVDIESEGVIPIDHDFLRSAIPASLLANGFTNPVSIVAAYYAPQADYSIRSTLIAPPAGLLVKSSSMLTIGDQELILRGGISLISRFDSRFGFDLLLPEGWRITEVTDFDGQPIAFDRYQAEGEPRIHVRLSERIGDGTPKRVFFKARSTPANWLDRWQENSIEFPLLKIDGATKHSGAIAVSHADDVTVKPVETFALETLDDQDKEKFEFNATDTALAWKFNTNDYKLTLGIQRLEPLISAKTYTFFALNPNQLTVRSELHYEVRQAKTDTFKFQLPLSAPASISIRGRNCRLKDFRSETTETARQWIVQLSERQTGTVQILVEFQQPLDESQLAKLELTPVRVDEVQFQTAMVAVEGSSELDVNVETKGRVVDIGELSTAAYKPGRFLLGSWAWPAADGTLTVNSTRRKVFALPAGIVQKAELVTSISADGKSQTAARFELVTDQPFLRVQLPANSSLWSVQLDGEPAKPQRHGKSLLISLIDKSSETGSDETESTETESTESQSNSIRDLQLVYESELDAVKLVGAITPEAPSLWLHRSSESDQGSAIPLVDMSWRLYLPNGYHVSRVDGNFQSNQLARRPSMVQRLGSWIYSVGGGVDQGSSNVIAADISLQGIHNYHDTFEMVDSEGYEQAAASEAMDFDPPPGFDDPSAAVNGAETKSEGRRDEAKEEFEKSIEQPDGEQKKAPAKPTYKTQSQLWALSGLRSLDIELTQTDNSIDFFSLGNDSRLQTTVVHSARINWLAIAIALLIGLGGVLLTRRSAKQKLCYVLVVVFIAGLLPVTGSFFDVIQPIADLALFAAVLVGVYFIVVAIAKHFMLTANLIATRISIALLVCGLIAAASQPADAQEVVKDVEQLRRLIVELQKTPELKLPADAIIIPFDPNDPDGREKATKLLLPYEHYIRLIEKSDDDKLNLETEPPVDYVLSSAKYSTELTLEEDLVVRGKLVLDLLTDNAISVALPLDGGALSQASVNGEPAKLQFKTSVKSTPVNSTPEQQQMQEMMQQEKAQPQTPASSVVLLHLEGKGKKEFEFTVRMKLQREGGWRSVLARLPVGLTRGIDILSLDEPTEIRLHADMQQRSLETKAGETIETVLAADGALRLQWKPSTEARVIDQSLTVQSEAIFDVREDGLRLAWRVDLDFRGSQRETFSLKLPEDFLVERVTGENVRSWELKQQGETRQLNVTLLSAAKDSEAFLIELSQRDFVVGDEAKQFDVPYLSVQGAALQKGMVTIRRSPIIELKTVQQRAANRIDADHAECKIDVKALESVASPLGITPFQCMSFVTTPFQIRLQAVLLPRKVTAETQSVFRIGQSEADFEMRIKFKTGQRPIHELSFLLPNDLELKQVNAGLGETWAIEKQEDRQLVHVWFRSGISGEFPLLITGSFTEYTGQPQLAIPVIELNEVDSQSGQIAVQVDPALTLTVSDLQNAETVLMQQLESWLNPDQRVATRLALRTRGADYSATLNLTRIAPRVSVETVTNVRLTYFAIEETILLDFDIQQAGIRQIKFLLPESLRNARINAQLVREKTIQPAPAPNEDMVQVVLDLQDEVMETFRVVIENDRQLSDSEQTAPIVIVETGETVQRYLTLQNAGRDELNVVSGEEFERLNPQLNQYAKLTQKLSGGELTMAYVAKRNVEKPELKYKAVRRQALNTVAASIEFAKTTMIVDSSGAYRALQNFQVNNRSEQYLDVELPAGATLLSVLVQGFPVKPVAWPQPGNDQRLRIPLVKTPAGDLDYPVQLKYAGAIGELTPIRKIDFPVIETLNIKVQLSQLHLRLPESHRWGNFGGTMTKVDSQGELEEGFLAYKGRQIQQLLDEVQNEPLYSKDFSRNRVKGNLGKLEKEMQTYRSIGGLDDNDEVRQQIELNEKAIETAQTYIIDASESMEELELDNRGNLNKLLTEQKSKIARNAITKYAANFDAINGAKPGENQGEQTAKPAKKGKAEFDEAWLSRNALNSGKGQSANASQPGQPPGYAPIKEGLILNGSGQAGFGGQEINYENFREQNQERQTMSGKKDLDSLVGDQPNDDAMLPIIRGERLRAGALNGGTVIEPNAPVAETTLRLSSLDIELPERGVDYYFKSPGGNVTVTARSLPESVVSRWLSVLVIAVLCLVCWIVWQVSSRLVKSGTARWLSVVLLGLLGFWSLGSGTFPIYGAIALLGAAIFVFDYLVRFAYRSDPSSDRVN